MPSKMMTICYVQYSSERQTSEYIIKEIAGVSRHDEDNIAFLRIKAFLPIGRDTASQIMPYKINDVIYLKGKFVAGPKFYTVCII